nr:DUF2155 domain-containing protein [Sulfitobacter faviae]
MDDRLGPALHALEHFRYDIWVMRCSTS